MAFPLSQFLIHLNRISSTLCATRRHQALDSRSSPGGTFACIHLYILTRGIYSTIIASTIFHSASFLGPKSSLRIVPDQETAQSSRPRIISHSGRPVHQPAEEILQLLVIVFLGHVAHRGSIILGIILVRGRGVGIAVLGEC